MEAVSRQRKKVGDVEGARTGETSDGPQSRLEGVWDAQDVEGPQMATRTYDKVNRGQSIIELAK